MGIIGIFVIIVVFLAGSHILYRPQYYSQKYVELTSDEDKKMFQRIMDLLDEDDDVQNVYHNVDEMEE